MDTHMRADTRKKGRWVLRIASKDRAIFQAIKTGRKKVETRAAGKKYADIQVGDEVQFMCAGVSIHRRVVALRRFRTVGALCRIYAPKQISPHTKTVEDLRRMYAAFPGYTRKIQRYGIVAIELK